MDQSNLDFSGITFKEIGSEELIQKKLCIAILTDKKLAIQLYEILDVKYFDLIFCRIIIDQFYKYFEEYKLFPSFDMLSDLCGKKCENNEILLNSVSELIYKAKSEGSENDPDFPMIKDKAVDFCRKQNIRKAMLLAQSKLSDLKFDDVSTILNKALHQGVEKNIGLNYERDIENRIVELTDREPVSTGYKYLDNIMRGGFGKGELILFIAPTSGGKSTFLVNLGVNALKEGKKVIHYTLELSENITALRYDSNIMGVPFDDFIEIEKIYKDEYGRDRKKLKIRDKVLNEMVDIKDKYLLPTSKLIVKKFPSRKATVSTIRSHLFKLEMEGIRPDLIIVDYVDIMKETKEKEHHRFELQELCGELRSLGEEYRTPVITCTQTNRDGYDNEMVSLKQISESYQKASEVDLALCFSRTNADKVRGTARLFVAKNRNGAEGIIFPVRYTSNIFKMDIYESCNYDELPEEFKGVEEGSTKTILKKYAKRD